MYRIAKTFRFEASHTLDYLPTDHKCRRLHGHSYAVEVILRSSEVRSTGFVRDFGDLDMVGEWIRDTLDHRHLNDVLECDPTSENIARYIYETWKGRLPELAAVRVSETVNTWAEYAP